MNDMAHHSVLLGPSVDALVLDPSGQYLDGTFGRGGHACAILNRLSSEGRLVAFDKDPEAIAQGQRLVERDPRFTLYHQSFSQMAECLAPESLSGVLLDLGVSSPQLDQAERGFSFLRDGLLDMRMNPTQGVAASQWLASAAESEIADVLFQYGEERFARRIARAMVAARLQQPLTRTHQLAEIIAAAHPRWEPHKHPATRAFQAIRIFINHELEDLERGLKASLTLLKPRGRLVVISFHSLEDRCVKRFVRDHARAPGWSKNSPFLPAQAFQPQLSPVGKAVKPNAEDIQTNIRARSAIMRVAEKMRRHEIEKIK